MIQKLGMGIGLLFLALVIARQHFAVQNVGGFSRSTPSEQQLSEPQAAVVAPEPAERLTLGDTSITVRLADTPAEREQGLSGTLSLPEEEGMLFFFETEGTPAFWMKDMYYAIDIIWLSNDWKVVDITAQFSPETYPATVSPQSPAQYVLEVPSGFAERHHVAIGQSVSFQK